MPGTNTLAELYLGGSPVGMTVRDDCLLIQLASGDELAFPLWLLGQIDDPETLPPTTQLLILRRPPQIERVRVTDRALHVHLRDGRVLTCPLTWFPRLLHGTPEERSHYVLTGDDDIIHWPELDEDIDLLRLFAGGPSTETEQSISRWSLTRAGTAGVVAG